MIGRVPGGLHPPVPAHQRRRHRDRLAEHHQVPASRPRPRRRQRRPAILTAACRAGDHRSPRRIATIRAPPGPGCHQAASSAGLAGNSTAGYKDTRGSRIRRASAPLLLPGVPQKARNHRQNTTACPGGTNKPPIQPASGITQRNRYRSLNPATKTPIYMALGAPGLVQHALQTHFPPRNRRPKSRLTPARSFRDECSPKITTDQG